MGACRRPRSPPTGAAGPGGRPGAPPTGRRWPATRSPTLRIVQRSGARSGVVQLLPADRRGDGCAGARADGVRGDQRLDRRVLRVVQAGLAAALGLRPLPGDEVRHRRADRPRELLDPGARVGEGVAPALDGDPGLDAAAAGRAWGSARTPRCSRAVRKRRARVRVSSQVVFVPGSMSMSAKVGRPRVVEHRGPGVDLERGLVAEPAQGRPPGPRRGGRSARGPRARGSRSRARS